MPKLFFFKPFFFLYLIFFRKINKRFQRSASNSHASPFKNYIFTFADLAHNSLADHSLIIFNMEEALLKSSSLFPYFMLVAFEAGSLLRALVLFLLYPLMFLVNEEVGLKIMVLVCFFGIKKESFRIGSSVLPKFFLEDVGLESFEVLQRAKNKKVGVSNLPQVMIETFLKDYLKVDLVIGRQLKVFGGYYLGLLENKKTLDLTILEEHGRHDKMGSSNIIGITSFNQRLNDPRFSCCKEIYRVRSSDKKSWKNLPRDKYPKKLVFHDGRLALKPTPLEIIAIFMWAPVGFVLVVIRSLIGLSLPYAVSSPLLAFTGLWLTVTTPKTQTLVQNDSTRTQNDKPKGVLYVCNHRTLLDPLCLCFALGKNLHAVTYSLSKMSEMLAPIKTVRLTRNRQQDQDMMERLLSQGDLVVCPEGTTCREPYLLRFSPLFSEITDEIVPVAVDTHVSMFHGTTASGLKSLDPVFFLLNPSPVYTIQLLEKVSSSEVSTCRDGSTSRFDVANYVQRELGKALGFECTKLTRRDKYLILAGNEGKAA